MLEFFSCHSIIRLQFDSLDSSLKARVSSLVGNPKINLTFCRGQSRHPPLFKIFHLLKIFWFCLWEQGEDRMAGALILELEPLEVYKNIVPLVEQHHERYDGKGYPKGLSGTDIDLGARVISVADVYDALVSQRPYRDGWVKDRALLFIQDNKETMFDPNIVEALLVVEGEAMQSFRPASTG